MNLINLLKNHPVIIILKLLEIEFQLLFSPGGELERFTTFGDEILINNNEIHIEALHSILSEIEVGKATLKSVLIK